MGISVASFVRSVARVDPYRVALVERAETRRVLDYGALDAETLRVAAALEAQGLEPGARVALIGESSIELVTAWLGAFAAGLVVRPRPPMSAPPEIAARVTHAGCAAIITSAACEARVTEACPALPRLSPAALRAHTHARATYVDRPAEALAVLLYTSGTTGAPRGVMITHASLATHTAAIVHHTLRLGAQDVVAGFLPLSHSYGMRMTLLAPFYAGARTVLMPRFDASRALVVAAEEGVTWWPMVPTMASALCRLEPRALPSLRFATSAGAPLAEDLRLRAERTLQRPLRDAYGLTEATFCTIGLPDDGGAAGTAGPPVAGVELRIIDPEGDPLPRGALGEICVRGQNLTAGYLDDARATQDALTRDGFFRTGDLGRLDEAGRLVVVDRLKDLIVRAGFNVVPSELEALLLRHPDVLEASVVGVPDPHLGEEIVAVVRASRTIDASTIDTYMRAALSPVKIPRRYAFVQQLPLGASGKVERRRLRDAIVAGSLAAERPGTIEVSKATRRR